MHALSFMKESSFCGREQTERNIHTPIPPPGKYIFQLTRDVSFQTCSTSKNDEL